MAGLCLGIGLTLVMTACQHKSVRVETTAINSESTIPLTAESTAGTAAEAELSAAGGTANKKTLAADPQETVVYENTPYLKSQLSNETLIWLDWYLGLPEDTRSAVSAVPHELVQPHGATMETAEYLKLADAPPLHFTDILSGTINQFSLYSGNYQWNYMENGGTVSMIACGAHPLDSNPDKTEKLDVPDYYNMEEVPYSISCNVMPDELMADIWGLDALGNSEQAAISQNTYEDTGLIGMKPNQIYRITAVWKDEKLEVRGFSGWASYTLITE